MDDLSSDPEVWEDLNRRFRARVYCGLLMGYHIESFALSAEILGRLSERGLRMDFFISPDAQDQPDEVSRPPPLTEGEAHGYHF